MKNLLQKILKILSQGVLKKYKPDVIGITGSVGKTSTKEAIYTVLKKQFNVRRSVKNYNNEIGAPLTILGCQSGGKNFFKWLVIFLKGLGLILFRDKKYPRILVLEMAADRPGDIKYLTDLAPCKIGVITSAAEVHLEFFKSLENIIKEKQTLVTHLKDTDWAVLNADEENVLTMKEKTKARILTFGFSEGVDAKAVGMEMDQMSNVKYQMSGINFKLVYQGKIVPIFLPNVLGEQQIYAALAGVSVGIIYEMNLVEISEALKNYQSPPGRTKLISGIKHTLIIDDTYNASPKSAKAALNLLKQLKVSSSSSLPKAFGTPRSGKKWAVLGDMMELGAYTEQGHQEVGEYAVQTGVDVIVTVGEKARDIIQGARKVGFSEDRLFNFAGAEAAGKFIQEKLREGDLLLIKGSQAMRMERIVKELMAEPLKAGELLVRQEWRDS